MITDSHQLIFFRIVHYFSIAGTTCATFPSHQFPIYRLCIFNNLLDNSYWYCTSWELMGTYTGLVYMKKSIEVSPIDPIQFCPRLIINPHKSWTSLHMTISQQRHTRSSLRKVRPFLAFSAHENMNSTLYDLIRSVKPVTRISKHFLIERLLSPRTSDSI